MTFKKYLTGEIKTDKDGFAAITTKKISGKIIKVRVIYNKLENKPAPETDLIITTVEEEKIVELLDWNKDIILYPRHIPTNEYFINVSINEQSQANQEPFVSVGPLVIEITKAGEFSKIDNIIILYEE